jgi:hypothetical protein
VRRACGKSAHVDVDLRIAAGVTAGIALPAEIARLALHALLAAQAALFEPLHALLAHAGLR